MPVSGMTNSDLMATMELLGWSIVEDCRPPNRRYPFLDFLREHGNGGPYIVNVTGHYIAVSHGELCDADANPLPQDIAVYLRRNVGGYRNSWVRRYWQFRDTARSDRS